MSHLSRMETRWLSLAVIGFLVLLCAGFAMLVATAFLPVEPAWLWPVSFLCIIVAAGMWLPLTLIIGAVADDVLSPDEKAEWEEAVFKRPFAIFELWWRHLR